MSQPYFFIRSNRQYVKILFDEIIYVEARRSYIAIHTDKGSHLILLSIRQLLKVLPTEKFCQIHRSCIVAIDRIVAFDMDTVVLKDARLPMGDKYRAELEGKVRIVVCEVRYAPKISKADLKKLVASSN